MSGPEREPYDDVAFVTAMTMVLMENYAETGHLGGPLAYIPCLVASHLGGPENGGLRYDLRVPKHPFSDRFMVCGGHGIPAAYALWMVLYEALRAEGEATGRADCAFDPSIAILPVDAVGFRRGAGALRTLLADHGLDGHPLFSDAARRGIRALSGHSESTDVTNDVNGGPSGVGVSTAAGKAMALDMAGAPPTMKVMALEGEFAMTEGHAQELKTTAVAQAVGKRLRVLLSENNAGIDDALVGGVVPAEFTGYRIPEQWSSYGWNVFTLADGCDVAAVLGALRRMEEWPAEDRRPMILVGRTLKGWWPGAQGGMLPGFGPLLTGARSHPWSQEMNGPYVRALAATFENRYGVRFEGISAGRPRTEADRLVQCLTDVNLALSVLRRVPGLSSWVAGRLLSIAGSFPRRPRLRFDPAAPAFPAERLRPETLPALPVEVPAGGATRTVTLFRRAGEKAGARRAVSEILKWAQHLSGNRLLTAAADLSSSVNVEDGHLTGHYHPVDNPRGTRLRAAIQEAGNTGLLLGALSLNFSEDPETYSGYWGLTATYGAFTPLMYTHVRVFSQQVQDSPFRLGVLTVLAAHSGPETAADARTHFGIFAPRVFDLLPRGRVLNLFAADYNDVAPAWFAAARLAAARREIGVIVLHVARPDAAVFDRMAFADPDLLAAARGVYLVRDFAPGLEPAGTVLLQGASATAGAVLLLPALEARGLNVRLLAVVSEDLFRFEAEDYRRRVLPEAALLDAMAVSTGTKRAPPVAGLPPVAEEYSLYADSDDRWRTGGSEADVVAEARLDPASILAGIERFVRDRPSRLARQRAALDALRDGPGGVG